MNCKSLLSALVAVLAVAASAPASAVLVLVNIDDFNVGSQMASDTTPNNVAVSNTLTSLDTAHVVGGTRTVTDNLTAGIIPYQSSTRVDTTVGQLIINNGVGEVTGSSVTWTLPASLLPTAGTISNFQFHMSLVGKDNNPVSVSVLLNSTSIGTASLPTAAVTAAQDLYFSGSTTSFNLGGTLQLVLNGNAGWDASFDTFGFQYEYTPPPTVTVPEPASLALFGLGAAGLYRRRRR